MDERPSRQRIPRLWVPSVLLLAICLVQAGLSPAASKATVGEQGLAPIRSYIAASWDTLTRSMTKCDTVVDPKLAERSILYLPADFPAPPAVAQIRKKCNVQVEHLPVVITGPGQVDPAKLGAPGLLYLPHSYVVPGGRFNEMYGWDSYFIQRGLLRDGELGLARNMTDNFTYEIAHYGMILNANRTYFLTRSQPPFLTEMILGVFDRTHDRAWLRATVPAIDRYYRFWTTPPHLVESTGLSRYFDLGNGPAPEVVSDERDAQGRTHYDRVREYYRTHQIDDYDVARFYDRAADTLTDRFYKGDRSMRESGFDPSNRFGPFSAAIIDYAPVCLNVLLYRMEQDAGRIHNLLGNPKAAAEWQRRAQRRRELVDRYLWDPQAGLYFDFHFETR